MKFKVGDKVRVKREKLLFYVTSQRSMDDPTEFYVKKILDDRVYYGEEAVAYHDAESLELVPEEPEFKLWEKIEVRNEGDDKWRKAIFLFYLPESFGYRYLCVKGYSSTSFKIWGCFDVAQRECARKLKQTLTRKEVAEKFGIAEDFILEE